MNTHYEVQRFVPANASINGREHWRSVPLMGENKMNNISMAQSHYDRVLERFKGARLVLFTEEVIELEVKAWAKME